MGGNNVQWRQETERQPIIDNDEAGGQFVLLLLGAINALFILVIVVRWLLVVGGWLMMLAFKTSMMAI